MLEKLSALFWGPWTLGLFLLTGAYFTLGSRFFPLRRWRLWWKAALGGLRRREKSAQPGLSPLQTTATALAATIGTGSIAGVAVAISLGGPGAVFWMWLSAILGMMTGCMEKTLSVFCRRKRANGQWLGGPMVWLETLNLRPLAVIFAVCALFASLGMGALVQSNSIAAGLEAAFSIPRPVCGIAVALLSGAALLGGNDRVGKVCEGLVPVMALCFLGMGVVTLFLRRQALPAALGEIFSSAFALRPAAGGGLGAAIQYGCARGVFTNEAGLGTTAMIHANSDATQPVEEGMRGLFEVFFATLVVCSITALVLLTAPEAAMDGLTGAARTSAAFRATLGQTGPALLSFCLTLFAFSSILGSYTYGQLGLEFLGVRSSQSYLPVFLGAVAIGAVVDVTSVWHLADLCTALMAWPTLLALLLFSPKLFRLLKKYEQTR